MTNLSMLIVFLLIFSSIVCDDNVTTKMTTVQPALSSSTVSSTFSLASSTTALPTSTSIAPSLENSTKLAQVPSNRTRHLNTTSYVCSCDLTFNCDNCCCDLDCGDGIVEAFDCATNLDIEDFHYGEGLERCGIDSGLLCIAHDNVVSDAKQLHAPFHPEYSSYRWPKAKSSTLEPQHNDVSHGAYRYGDAILTYDSSGEKTQTIKIPAYSLNDNAHCYLHEPVQFLKSKSIRCLRSINELCSYNNNLMLQLLNTKLLHRPSAKMTANVEASDAFNIVIEACRHSFSNCMHVSQNNNATEVMEYLGDELYEDIRFTFVINDTQIKSAIVRMACHNEWACESEELETTKIVQHIEVEFQNENEMKSDRRIRMKARGFFNDQLIVASKLRPVNESAPNSGMILDFFRNDSMTYDDYYLMLPSTKDGKCVLNDHIRFNEDSQTNCVVELSRDENLNFTLCQQFQQQLIHFLFNAMNLTSNYTADGYLSDVFVSKFWTPQYGLDSWSRVSLVNVPLWNPEMHESEKMFTCSNLVTSASYVFYYSTIRGGVKKYEHFVENLIVNFDRVEDLHFSLLNDENQTAKINIQINVQFSNLYRKTVKSHARNVLVNLHLINLLVNVAYYISNLTL